MKVEVKTFIQTGSNEWWWWYPTKSTTPRASLQHPWESGWKDTRKIEIGSFHHTTTTGNGILAPRSIVVHHLPRLIILITDLSSCNLTFPPDKDQLVLCNDDYSWSRALRCQSFGHCFYWLNGIGENVFQHGFDLFAINHLQELLLQAEGIEAFLQVPFRCQGHLGPGCWLLAVSMVWESNVIIFSGSSQISQKIKV